MADEEEEVYRLKASKYGTRNVSIIMQGANGPCPLIALANVLLLRGKIVLNADYGRVAFGDLLALVADHLCASNPPVKDDAEREANRQQQISDVIAILPKLKVRGRPRGGVERSERVANVPCLLTRALRPADPSPLHRSVSTSMCALRT